MAIDFPSSPSLNQTFTVGDVIYKWDGTVWTSTVSGAVDFLPITGGTLTGAVTFNDNISGDISGGTLGGSQVRTAMSDQSTSGDLGSYALLKKTTAGGAGAGLTVAGADCRFSSAAGNSSGTPAGTWLVLGRMLDDGAQTGEKLTTVCLRIL